jgi:hypothetical protein
MPIQIVNGRKVLSLDMIEEMSLRRKKWYENPENRKKTSNGNKNAYVKNPKLYDIYKDSARNNKISNKLIGHVHSKSTIEKIRQKAIGRLHKEETKAKMSDTSIKNIIAGKTHLLFSKGGIREDLKEYGHIASATEANYIRYLKYFEIEFEYQVPILLSNNRWYICDFYLSKTKEFVELKGYLNEKNKIKYELLKQSYPIMNWKIILCNSIEWKKINQFGKENILHWERR